MARYKVTFGFQSYVFGPSESYITGDISASALADTLNRLIGLRNNLLYDTTNWAGVRYGVVGGVRRSVFYPPGDYNLIEGGAPLVVPAKGALSSTTIINRQDQARAALQIRVTYDNDRRVIRYLSFVPDNVLYDEPASFRPQQNPSWAAAFGLFQAELISGRWFIRARKRDGAFMPRPIVDWVQSSTSPTNLGVVLPAAPAPGIVQGQMIQISGVRRKGWDKLSYNGRYFVQSVNTTLQPDFVVYYLRQTEAGDPASIKLPGTIQPIGYDYFAIQGYSGIRAGTHKRGKPLGTPLGRRKTRVSLDP